MKTHIRKAGIIYCDRCELPIKDEANRDFRNTFNFHKTCPADPLLPDIDTLIDDFELEISIGTSITDRQREFKQAIKSELEKSYLQGRIDEAKTCEKAQRHNLKSEIIRVLGALSEQAWTMPRGRKVIDLDAVDKLIRSLK